MDGLKRKASINFNVDEKLKSKWEDKALEAKRETQYQKPLTSILVKPAGPDCNMKCEYCFYLKKNELFQESKIHRMSDEILEEMIRQAMSQSVGYISFAWQGGEPTLMGSPFFEKAVEFQKKYGRNQTVGNGLQTNGLLLDEKWAKFLKENNFLVGLSLDGPRHIHDHYRFTKGGKGSWAKVIEKAKLLLDAGVAVNTLTVLNNYSALFPKEIYEFLKDFGLTYMQFIPCVETDPRNPGRAAPFSISPEKYGECLCTLFDLWYSDFTDQGPSTSVRFFDSLFHSYVGLNPPDCTLLKECGIYVVVEHNGDIYACDFFVEPEYRLGNLMEDKLIDMLNSPRQNAFGQIKSTLSNVCTDCQWLSLCCGGCPKDRLRDPRDMKVSHFCKSHRMFFEHADGRLRQLAEEWRRNQMKSVKDDKKVVSKIKQRESKVGRNDPCPCGSGLKYKKCCGS